MMTGPQGPSFLLMSNSALPKNHKHYSKEVQVLVSAFEDVYLSYSKMGKYNFKENLIRMEAVKVAWDALLKARKEETGVSWYLDEKGYQEAINVKFA